MSRINAPGPAGATPRRPASPPDGGRGFPLFRIFGIQIRLDWSWLIIFFVMVFVLREYFRPILEGQPEWAVWLLSAVSVIALFVCVLAHELGHSLVAMRHGIQMFDITLFVFGGMARLRGEPRNASDELKIALAGPAVTVVLSAGFWLAWWALDGRVSMLVSEGLRYLGFINAVLLAFNLVPGFPLDGGRVLRAVLWRIRGNLLSATQTAAAVGKGFAVVLAVLGLVAILNREWAGLFYIFLGWFLANAANQSVQHLQIRRVLEVFRVADAMQRNIVSVSGQMPLDRLVVDGFYRHHFKSFPVVDQNVFRGLISLPEVQRVPADRWPATTVQQVMLPQSADWTIHPDDGLYEAFRRMGEDDIGRLVVTDHAGQVVGMISRRDILRFLQIYSGLNPTLASQPQQAIPLAEPVPGDASGDRSARPPVAQRIDVTAEPPPARESTRPAERTTP